MAGIATALVWDSISPEKAGQQSVELWSHISTEITDGRIMESGFRVQSVADGQESSQALGSSNGLSPREFLQTFKDNFDLYDGDKDGFILRKELEAASRTDLSMEAKEVARVVLEHFGDISKMGNNTDSLVGKEPWNLSHPFHSAISRYDLKAFGYSMSPNIMREGPLGGRVDGLMRGVGAVVDGFAAASIGSTVAWGGSIAYLAGLTKVGGYGIVGGGLLLAYGLYSMQKPAWTLQSTQQGLNSNFKAMQSWNYFDFDKMWREDPPYERPGAGRRPGSESPLLPRDLGLEKQNQQPERRQSPGSWQSDGKPLPRRTISL